MRLIDADALWEKMYKYSDNEGAKMPYGDDDSLIHRDSACFLIEEAPTIEIERKSSCSEFPNNWIPCSVKKHPDKSMYCHVTVIDDGDYIVGNDDWDAGSESWDEYSDDEIIAWMPEITPYQEAKGNECRDILEG